MISCPANDLAGLYASSLHTSVFMIVSHTGLPMCPRPSSLPSPRLALCITNEYLVAHDQTPLFCAVLSFIAGALDARV